VYSLSPGDYTVRVGGIASAGKLFQAGIDEVSLSIRPIHPEEDGLRPYEQHGSGTTH
jgi:hypothetical protein